MQNNSLLEKYTNNGASGMQAMSARVFWVGPSAAVALASLAAWITLVASGTESGVVPGICGGAPRSVDDIAGALRATFLFISPSHLAYHWLLMVVAMMGPALAILLRMPIGVADPRGASLPFAFIASYLGVWTASGILFVPALLLVRTVIPESGYVIGLLVFLGLSWRPARTWLIRLGGPSKSLGKIGCLAARPARKVGAYASCRIGACWPPMVLPSLSHDHHLLTMFAATLWMCCERHIRVLSSDANSNQPLSSIGRSLHVSLGQLACRAVRRRQRSSSGPNCP